MLHLGDIKKINGDEVPAVNVMIGGSPCQDLSVAGRRAGLDGEQSSLFMEQIRVIKEARTADAKRGRTGTCIRPRFMVWENVKGCFSSNKGEDFGRVLWETVKVAEPEAPAVPVPKGGWPNAGCLYRVDGTGAGRWSLAWRVLDAQFWGVPQHRERIALVADFGGLSAPEILFEREGMSGDTQQGSKGEQETSGNIGAGPKCPSGIILNDMGGSCMNIKYDVFGTLRAQEHGHQQLVIK